MSIRILTLIAFILTPSYGYDVDFLDMLDSFMDKNDSEVEEAPSESKPLPQPTPKRNKNFIPTSEHNIGEWLEI